MIGKRQLALARCACEKLELSDESLARMLMVAGAARIEDLTKPGFELFMDQCTTLNFRDPRRPVLSKATYEALETTIDGVRMTAFQRATLLRSQGRCSKVSELDGMGLIRILFYLDSAGVEVDEFIKARNDSTLKQRGLIIVARRETGISDQNYSSLLQHYGGVNSLSHIDQRGIDLMMAYLRFIGFDDRKEAVSAPDFGARPGFASAAQLGLIRELWAEWSGGSDEAGLVTWLERSYRVSALRFLTGETASKAITALKAMKRRKAQPSQVTA